MHTRKASFRLPAVIICFAAVLGMVSCLDSKPWKNPCRKGGNHDYSRETIRRAMSAT